MKRWTLMVASVMTLVAAGAMPGCRSASSGPGSSLLRYEGTEDAQVRSVVFHQMLLSQPKDQLVFLSFGKSSTSWVDPPETFYRYLADTGLKLAPASKARIPRMGQTAKDGGPAKIVDSSGKAGRLYSVRITHWIDDNAAAVEGSRLEGAVPVAGIHCTVRRVNGSHWLIEEAEFW